MNRKTARKYLAKEVWNQRARIPVSKSSKLNPNEHAIDEWRRDRPPDAQETAPYSEKGLPAAGGGVWTGGLTLKWTVAANQGVRRIGGIFQRPLTPEKDCLYRSTMPRSCTVI